jgi:multidrug resistance efflux pump
MTDAKPKREGEALLWKLLELKEGLDKAGDLRAARVVLVNLIANLVSSDQAVLWCGSTTPAAASNVKEIDRHAPHIQDLRRLYKTTLSKAQKPFILSSDCLDSVPSFKGAQGGMYVPLPNADGGLLVVKGQGQYRSAQLAVMGLVTMIAAGKVVPRPGGLRQVLTTARAPYVFVGSVAILLLLASFIPVPQTILAPVEIISRDISYIKAPANGLIRDVFVEPGDFVERGASLINLDTAQLEAQLEIALAEHAQLSVEYEQETIKALSEASARFRLAEIQAGLSEKSAQVDFLEEQIRQHAVTAPRSGVVSISEIEEIRGRPVSIGETLMTIADPEQLELELWLPLQTSLPVDAGDAVTVFLNSNPIDPYNGAVRYVTSQPQMRPDNSMGYRGRASLNEADKLPNSVLGQQGVARINTGIESLFMKLMRQPIAWIRQSVGI